MTHQADAWQKRHVVSHSGARARTFLDADLPRDVGFVAFVAAAAFARGFVAAVFAAV
jgi:hypothetical protein